MLSIKPRSGLKGQEELGPICIPTRVCHRQKTFLSVAELKVLIWELLAIYALSTGSIEGSEIATLHHELLNDSVEDTVFEGELAPRDLADPSLSCAELSEVLGCPRSHILEQLHYDSPRSSSVDLDVKEDAGV